MKPQTTPYLKSEKGFKDTCEKQRKVIEKIYDSNLEHVLDVYFQNSVRFEKGSLSSLKTFHRLYLEEKKSVKKICSKHRTPRKKAKKNMLIFLGVLGMLLVDVQSCPFKETKIMEAPLGISNKEVDATEESLRTPNSLEEVKTSQRQEKNKKLKAYYPSEEGVSDFEVFRSIGLGL